MTDTTAFRATYSDWKLIRSRKVVQIVMEVPVELADQAYSVLGGMPNPAEEVWCGIARLKQISNLTPNAETLAALHEAESGAEPVNSRQPSAETTAAELGKGTLGQPAKAEPRREPQPGGAALCQEVMQNTGLSTESPQLDKTKPARRTHAQRAGYLCTLPDFWSFLEETEDFVVNNEEDAAKVVRWLCEVDSRSQIDSDDLATKRWTEITAGFDYYMMGRA